MENSYPTYVTEVLEPNIIPQDKANSKPNVQKSCHEHSQKVFNQRNAAILRRINLGNQRG